MGKGPKATEDRVTKVRQDNSSTGFGVGGGSSRDVADDCLFTVIGAVEVDWEVFIGDEVVIVPNVINKGVDLYITGTLVGQYEGKGSQRMFKCTSGGYVYEGVVKQIVAKGKVYFVTFSLTGKKKPV